MLQADGTLTAVCCQSKKQNTFLIKISTADSKLTAICCQPAFKGENDK